MFGRKSRGAATTAPTTAPAAPAPPTIEVRYINRQYYSNCPSGPACPESPRQGLPWTAVKPQRQASIEALYVHLHRVHNMPVPDIEALPVKDA